MKDLSEFENDLMLEVISETWEEIRGKSASIDPNNPEELGNFILTSSGLLLRKCLRAYHGWLAHQ